MKEKLKLKSDEARIIIWGDSNDYRIVEDNIIGVSRWSIIHRIVIERISDGKFFADTYRKGATECQEESPYEHTNPNFEEVQRVERTVVVYE